MGGRKGRCVTCIAPVWSSHEDAVSRRIMTALVIAIPAIASMICACRCSDRPSKWSYGNGLAQIEESSALPGPKVKVAGFRWSGEFVLLDSDPPARG